MKLAELLPLKYFHSAFWEFCYACHRSSLAYLKNEPDLEKSLV